MTKFNITATVEELKFGTYLSVFDHYSKQTWAKFVNDADDALAFWEATHEKIHSLRNKIFDNYDVFLAGKRNG